MRLISPVYLMTTLYSIDIYSTPRQGRVVLAHSNKTTESTYLYEIVTLRTYDTT